MGSDFGCPLGAFKKMSTSEVTLITAIVGAVTGATGAVFGVLNYLRDQRVRLRVVPLVAYGLSGGTAFLDNHVTKSVRLAEKDGIPGRIVVQVVNLSFFPVVLKEVGLGTVRTDNIQKFLRPRAAKAGIGEVGVELPVRLDPREAAHVFAPEGFRLDLARGLATRGFAITDCGKVAYGTSPILHHYFRQAKA